MMLRNMFSTFTFIWVQEKTGWKNKLTKQGRALTSLHIKKTSKITKKVKKRWPPWTGVE